MGTRGRGKVTDGPISGAGSSTGTEPGYGPAGPDEYGDYTVYDDSGPSWGASRGAARTASSPAPVRGRAERRRTAQRAARRRRRSLLRELPLIAVVALIIAVILKTFLVQVFVIPSGSMEQTIQVGDRVLVDRLTPWFGSEPGRGDVVVFQDPGGWLEQDHARSTDGPVMRRVKSALATVGLIPSDNGDLIKRVIGLPGDTVECCDEQGRLSVNGTPLDEPYIAAGNAPSRQPFKVTVPAGRLWVMGDHRDLSADSRFHMANPGNGTIPISNVVGRAFMIAWPVSRVGQLGAPTSLSSLPTRPVAAGRGEAPVAVGVPGSQLPPGRPDPAEPPLVMGVLGVLPVLVRRRQ
ncbi:signal peptidase I [Kitasatospora sp. NPDC048540]|uniref:signal peptidase I n=1 Tax=unclassified Kitasatospora TaxID=2633591 RepID=UPI0009E9F7CD|nr:signal peptidase I [Kitasatospora sp. MBT63]